MYYKICDNASYFATLSTYQLYRSSFDEFYPRAYQDQFKRKYDTFVTYDYPVGACQPELQKSQYHGDCSSIGSEKMERKYYQFVEAPVYQKIHSTQELQKSHFDLPFKSADYQYERKYQEFYYTSEPKRPERSTQELLKTNFDIPYKAPTSDFYRKNQIFYERK